MLLIEPFEHAPRLLDALARAFDRDVIAALLRDDAEPALDQREVLAVLAEQQRGEAIVVEGEHDLASGAAVRAAGDESLRSVRAGAQRLHAPATASASGARARRRSGERAEQAVGADFGDRHRGISPIRSGGAIDLHRLEIWGAADDLARMAAGLFEQHVEGAAAAARVEGGLLRGRSRPAGAAAARPSRPPAPGPACRPPACPAAANI